MLRSSQLSRMTAAMKQYSQGRLPGRLTVAEAICPIHSLMLSAWRLGRG